MTEPMHLEREGVLGGPWLHPSLEREGTRVDVGGVERRVAVSMGTRPRQTNELYKQLPMTEGLFNPAVVVHNHSEAYRAYCMLRADLDASFAGGPRVDEDATLDAMAGLLEMMLPTERALLDHEGPMVLP